MTCKIDPADDACLTDVPPDDQDPDNACFCFQCNLTVKKSSKHCSECKKCIDRFDHHCLWLNTCVGKKNYRWFITTVLSVFVLLMLILCPCVAYFIELCASPGGIEERSYDSFVNLDQIGLFIVTILCMVVVAPLVSLVIQLVCFHIGLWVAGQTTYEFVIYQHRKINERRRAKEKSRLQGGSGDTGSRNSSGSSGTSSANKRRVGNESATQVNSSEVKRREGYELAESNDQDVDGNV